MEAENDYSKALELNGTLSDAYLNRGLVRMYQKKWALAEADFTQAFQLNPALQEQHQESINDFKKRYKARP